MTKASIFGANETYSLDAHDIEHEMESALTVIMNRHKDRFNVRELEYLAYAAANMAAVNIRILESINRVEKRR